MGREGFGFLGYFPSGREIKIKIKISMKQQSFPGCLFVCFIGVFFGFFPRGGLGCGFNFGWEKQGLMGLQSSSSLSLDFWGDFFFPAGVGFGACAGVKFPSLG